MLGEADPVMREGSFAVSLRCIEIREKLKSDQFSCL